jgi:hypothetical protein
VRFARQLSSCAENCRINGRTGSVTAARGRISCILGIGHGRGVCFDISDYGSFDEQTRGDKREVVKAREYHLSESANFTKANYYSFRQRHHGYIPLSPAFSLFSVPS